MSSAGARPPAIRRSARCAPAIARSFATVIWTMLTACTVGPNFKPPESPSTTRYLAASEPAGASDAATSQSPRQAIALGQKVTTEWWALLKSPELDALVARAIEDSRTLESARARLAQARESVAAASSVLFPSKPQCRRLPRALERGKLRIEPERISFAAQFQSAPGRSDCKLLTRPVRRHAPPYRTAIGIGGVSVRPAGCHLSVSHRQYHNGSDRDRFPASAIKGRRGHSRD